jgi:hypothetical protein
METSVYNSLTVHSPVIVLSNPEYIHPTWFNKNFRYDGTVKTIREHYINRGAKYFGKERAVYVGFIDKCVYDNILMKGSMIMCYIHNNLLNCFIRNVLRDISGVITSMEVAIYDDEDIAKICPITYTIDTSKIDSMLITDKAYIIKNL